MMIQTISPSFNQNSKPGPRNTYILKQVLNIKTFLTVFGFFFTKIGVNFPTFTRQIIAPIMFIQNTNIIWCKLGQK